MSYRDFCDRFRKALNSGDFDTQSSMLSPDFVVTEAAGLPYSGTYRGAEGWKELATAVVRTWSGFRLEFLEYVGETESTLVVRFAISGTSRKTGRSFESTVMELWRFENGLLSEILPYYWDTQLLAAADAQAGEQ